MSSLMVSKHRNSLTCDISPAQYLLPANVGVATISVTVLREALLGSQFARVVIFLLGARSNSIYVSIVSAKNFRQPVKFSVNVISRFPVSSHSAVIQDCV